MNKTHTTTCLTAFFVGLLAIGWVGAGYVGTSPLALVMTALIGAVYVAGALELRRFSRATDSLGQALAGVPDVLPDLLRGLRRASRRAMSAPSSGSPIPRASSCSRQFSPSSSNRKPVTLRYRCSFWVWYR